MDKISELISKLIDIVKMKKSKYRLLLINTEKQREVITNNENFDKLLELIDNRQKIMNDIDDLDFEFNTIFNELKEITGLDDISKLDYKRYFQLRQLKELVTDILSLGKKIDDIENKNKELLIGNKSKSEKELNVIKHNSKKILSYFATYNKSKFIDKRK